MQAFYCEVIARRPRRVLSAPDASLAREAGSRLTGPMRVGRPSIVGAAGDVRPSGERRWVAGQAHGCEATSSSTDNTQGVRNASGSW